MVAKKFFKALFVVTILLTILSPDTALAQEATNTEPTEKYSFIAELKEKASHSIEYFNDALGSVLFVTIRGYFCDDLPICEVDWVNEMEQSTLGGLLVNMPFLIAWLVFGGLFFTLRLGFINLRLFTHSFDVVRGKYSKDSDPGEVTHFQALSSAVSATVGLGNIAGVAVAVALGGPGAIFWMMVAGFMGMNTKFAEVTMGLKYREFDAQGRVNGGAYEYLSKGLAELNFASLGKILAFVFAICCVGGSIGGGNLFQSNQATALLANTFEPLKDYRWAISLTMAVLVAIILFGGIKRIAEVAVRIVPFMAVLYVSSCLIIIFYNFEHIGDAVSTIFSSAFEGNAITGGILGAIINGFKRAAFSSEAGVGSAPTAHSAAKTTEPVREGVVALLEPFLDTIVVCFMTGLVIVITGSYVDNNLSGVVLTSTAFASVSEWFPYLLTLAITLFAFSTILTWGYYGSKAMAYLFGDRIQPAFKIIFCFATFIGGIVSLDIVIEFSDLLLLSMAVPNLLGMYFLSGIVARETKEYIRKLKNNEFEIVKK